MRVALFCETLNPESSPYARFYSHLARSLSELGHQVSIWTGPFHDNGRFEIENVQYFYLLQKFRVWEIPKLLPHLMQIQPDVFHFFPQAEQFKTRLHIMNALSVLARSLRGPIVLTSLLENPAAMKGSTPKNFKPMRTLLEQSHLVTAVDPSQLEQLRASKTHLANFEIWPKRINTHSVHLKHEKSMSQKNINQSQLNPNNMSKMSYEALENFIESHSHILILPGPLAHHDPKQLKFLFETCDFLKGTGVLITEEWGEISQAQRRQIWLPLLDRLTQQSRLLITGQIDRSLRQRLQDRSLGCWLSSLAPSIWISQAHFWEQLELWGRTFINSGQQKDLAIEPAHQQDFVVVPSSDFTGASSSGRDSSSRNFSATDLQNWLAHQLSFLPRAANAQTDFASDGRVQSSSSPANQDDPYNQLNRIYSSLISQQNT